MKLTTKPYADHITEYTLVNDNGMRVSFIDYGCIITDVVVPDRDGRFKSVILSFDSLEEYQKNRNFYFGAIVGRFTGRISNASFALHDSVYRVCDNDGVNSLHGGGEFSEAFWEAEERSSDSCVGVKFTLISPDGSRGFPGNVATSVVYSLDNTNTFYIKINAQTDRETVLNISNHTYFNLSGNCSRDVRDHLLCTPVSSYAAIREDCTPTGELVPVSGTPFDFRNPAPIRSGTESDYAQNVIVGNGFDHPFLFDEDAEKLLTLKDPQSGRKLTIRTDYPAFVMYSCSAMPEGIPMKYGQTGQYAGLALEAQYLPDCMNKSGFGNCTIKEDEEYSHFISWSFDVDA